MNEFIGPMLHFEASKLIRATVTKVATGASIMIVLLTSVGGYAAAIHSADTDIGRKTTAMLQAEGWAGYVGLAALSLGVVSVLVVGFVLAWVVGREFTEQTVVGLFALPVSTAAVGLAKIATTMSWALLVTVVEAALVSCGGVLLGLPASGALGCMASLVAVGGTLVLSMAIVAWVATITEGYLGGIAATLAIVVTSNISAGFGAGEFIPWAIPSLWASPESQLPTPWLFLPLLVGAVGIVLTWFSWRNLQLGDR